MSHFYLCCSNIYLCWSNFYIYYTNFYICWSNFYILVKFIYIVVKFLYIVVKFYIYLRLSYFRKLSETIYSLQVHSRLRKGHTYANLMVWLFHLVAPLDWFLQKNDRKNLFGCILDNFFFSIGLHKVSNRYLLSSRTISFVLVGFYVDLKKIRKNYFWHPY